MDKAKQLRLEKKGWKVGTVAEFLNLTPEEEALIEIKLALSRSLKRRRPQHMTLADLAERVHSTEPKLAKAEDGDASTSMELLVKAILATGGTPQDIGRAISGTTQRRQLANILN